MWKGPHGWPCTKRMGTLHGELCIVIFYVLLTMHLDTSV
jgi:hypothetical protein